MITRQEQARALRRLVYTDKLLTIEQAYRYCDVAGIPRTELTNGAPMSISSNDESTPAIVAQAKRA